MQSGLYAAIVVTDSEGSRFSLPQPAQRIVSLAPHITELLFAVGAGERLVGTVEHSDFPKRALSVARVGNHQSLDLEAILALKPDLVLAWSAGSPIPGLEKLKTLGIPVYVSGSRGVGDIATLLRTFASLAGMSWRGEEVASHFERLLDELRQQYAHRSRVSVFLQIWDKPLMTINGHHYTNDVIELCGGRNIFADLGSVAPTVGVEAVISRDPEVIFVNGKGSQYRQWLNAWRVWPQLQAVRNDYLYEIKAHTIARPTPRILMGAKRICQVLDAVRQSR
jgi:iron complex transport system substrate-binding protein